MADSWHSTYGCFELAGLFASSLQRKLSDASTIDCRGTALVARAQYLLEAGNAKKPAAYYKPRAKVRNCWCYSTLCLISKLHDPVDSQR